MKNEWLLNIKESTARVVLAPKGYVRKIRYRVEDKESNRSTGSTITFSKHSMRRAQQRGISQRAILLALTYGDCITKQGMNFHVVRNKDLHGQLSTQDRDMMRHLVVVMDENDYEMITCYRSGNGVRHVRRKTKYLLSN